MSDIQLIYRPPRLPDELLVGYIWRAAHAGGHARIKGLATTLVDRNTIQPPWTVPSNLFRLLDNLAPVFSSAEEIFEHHTCLPAFMPFVPVLSRANLFAHVFAGEERMGIAGVLGLTGKASKFGPRMALCRKCMQEDELQYGIAYWHREHALPSLGYCPHHHLPLLAGCGECAYTRKDSRRPLIPKRFCWCGNSYALAFPGVSDADGRVLSRMAEMGYSLLNGALRSATPNAVGAYFHMSAHESGFEYGSYVKTPALVAAIRSRYSSDVLGRLNAALDSNQNWLRQSMGSMRATNVLGRNLMLFDFFGRRIPTLEDLALAVEHRRKMLEARARSTRTNLNASPLQIERDRKAILEYLKENPKATRSQVLDALGRTAVNARDRDSEWYDSLLSALPRGGNMRVRGTRERGDYWKEFDARTEAHVRARRDELLQSAVASPVRLTKLSCLREPHAGTRYHPQCWRRCRSRPLLWMNQLRVRWTTRSGLRV